MLDEDAAQMRMQHRSVAHDLVELFVGERERRLICGLSLRAVRGGGVLGGGVREGVHGASLLRLNNAFITTCALRPFQRNERLRLVSA